MDNKKIIHLYLLNRCTHHCKFCCNKQYSVDEIPVVTVDELKYAETVCLTGGEPFLLDNICDVAKSIKQQYPNIKYVYVYTCGDSLYDFLMEGNSLHNIDGVNIAPKNKYDAECVNRIFEHYNLKSQVLRLWSNRIYLFPEVKRLIRISDIKDYESVSIIEREWQEEFKAASGIFRRIPILLD